LLLLPKDLKNPDPVALSDKIDVAVFIEPLFQGISYKVPGHPGRSFDLDQDVPTVYMLSVH
jgi:hypothetical protein